MSSHQQTRPTDETYLSALGSDSARFADVLEAAPVGAAVPTCPGWDADALLAHLLTVQTFWQRVIADALTTDEQVIALGEPSIPTRRAALVEAMRAASGRLVDTLAATPADAPRWSWSAEQTAGFTTRRQAHEACMHRLDAELTVAPDGSARTPIDAALAADGVDEALRVVLSAAPPWATITPQAGRTVRVVATDTGDTWLVTLARRTGSDPEGREHDDPTIYVAGQDPVDGTVHPAGILSGTAEDLYCRLWRRPVLTEPQRAGDQALVAELEGALEVAAR